MNDDTKMSHHRNAICNNSAEVIIRQGSCPEFTDSPASVEAWNSKQKAVEFIEHLRENGKDSRLIDKAIEAIEVASMYAVKSITANV